MKLRTSFIFNLPFSSNDPEENFIKYLTLLNDNRARAYKENCNLLLAMIC